VRRRLGRWLDNPALLERELMTLMWAGIRGYRMEPKFPAILTDGQLGAIGVPVLLITGARSALITPAQARDRAARMPDAEVAIVPGSHGHFNRTSELNDRIAAFIDAHSAISPSASGG
jgi:pimeloyl-ACP methyl ester carboxylesterase